MGRGGGLFVGSLRLMRVITLLVVYLVGRVGDALRRKAIFGAYTPRTVRVGFGARCIICAAATFRRRSHRCPALPEATDNNAVVRVSCLPPLEGRRCRHFRTLLQLAELGVSRLGV